MSANDPKRTWSRRACETYIAYRKDNVPSSYGERFVAALRQQMAALSATPTQRREATRVR